MQIRLELYSPSGDMTGVTAVYIDDVHYQKSEKLPGVTAQGGYGSYVNVAVDQTDPNLVYVLSDNNPSSDSAAGDFRGVWKTADSGTTWRLSTRLLPAPNNVTDPKTRSFSKYFGQLLAVGGGLTSRATVVAGTRLPALQELRLRRDLVGGHVQQQPGQAEVPRPSGLLHLAREHQQHLCQLRGDRPASASAHLLLGRRWSPGGELRRQRELHHRGRPHRQRQSLVRDARLGLGDQCGLTDRAHRRSNDSNHVFVEAKTPARTLPQPAERMYQRGWRRSGLVQPCHRLVDLVGTRHTVLPRERAGFSAVQSRWCATALPGRSSARSSTKGSRGSQGVTGSRSARPAHRLRARAPGPPRLRRTTG